MWKGAATVVVVDLSILVFISATILSKEVVLGGGSKGIIGQHGPTASILDETCCCNDSCLSMLEHVHKVLWPSDLPAAVCVLPDRTTSIAAPNHSVNLMSLTAAVIIGRCCCCCCWMEERGCSFCHNNLEGGAVEWMPLVVPLAGSLLSLLLY